MCVGVASGRGQTKKQHQFGYPEIVSIACNFPIRYDIRIGRFEDEPRENQAGQ